MLGNMRYRRRADLPNDDLIRIAQQSYALLSIAVECLGLPRQMHPLDNTGHLLALHEASRREVD
jgi:hypothetical protein